jgi:cation transport protein ChaC
MASQHDIGTAHAEPEGPIIEDGHFWVFGYGSLMWRPDFDYKRMVPARMGGVHRAPCIYSWVHRGTEQSPGIVLGLAEGGSCSGMAFEVAERSANDVVAYLRERELVTHVYREINRPAQITEDGMARSISCLTYVVNRYHEQYAGELPVDQLVTIISQAEGKSGKNDAYFLDTHRQLDAMGIDDPKISAITEGLKHHQVR